MHIPLPIFLWKLRFKQGTNRSILFWVCAGSQITGQARAESNDKLVYVCVRKGFPIQNTIPKGGSKLKRTTKRLVSSVLAASMLLSSMFTSNTFVSAADFSVADAVVSSSAISAYGTNGTYLVNTQFDAENNDRVKANNEAQIGESGVYIVNNGPSAMLFKNDRTFAFTNTNVGEQTGFVEMGKGNKYYKDGNGSGDPVVGTADEKFAVKLDLEIGEYVNSKIVPENVEKGFRFEITEPVTIQLLAAAHNADASIPFYVFDEYFGLTQKLNFTFIDKGTVDAPTRKAEALSITFDAPGTYYGVVPDGVSTLDIVGVIVGAEAPVDETTTANVTEAPTEATTEAPTEATTAAPVTEAPTEAKTEFVPSADTMYVQGKVAGSDSNVIDKALIGSQTDIEFDILNNQGFSSYTLFLTYDPSVVKPVAVKAPADGYDASYVSIPSTVNFPGLGPVTMYTPVFEEATVNNQIKLVPLASDEDYTDVKADGVKSAAELGKVKLAWTAPASYVDSNNNILEVTGNGKFVVITFDVVGEGDAKIALDGSFAPSPVNSQAGKVNKYESAPSDIEVAEIKEEPTTEATTVAPVTEEDTETTTSEVTTKAQVVTEATEATTAEATTEATTKGNDVIVIVVTEDVSETTTHKSGRASSLSGGGGGGGGSSSSSSRTTTTTEAATEDTTDSDVEATTKKAVVEETTEATTKSSVELFNDIASKPWAADAINSLAQLGIINGVGNGKFDPDANCKRADFAIILVNVLGISGTATDNFDDVVPGKYYYNAVGLAKEAGIVNGYGNGKFGPENFCTRAELMVMVANALKVAGKDISADESVLDKFSDKADIPTWAVPYVAYLVDAGIVSGSNGKINPNVSITRAEVAVIMYNVYEALEADKAAEEAVVVEEAADDEVVTSTIETTVEGYDENVYAGDSDKEATEVDQ